jgi:CBS domain-containing protein
LLWIPKKRYALKEKTGGYMNKAATTNPELDNIKSFLEGCTPFDLLDDTDLHNVIAAIEISYFRSGHKFLPDDDSGGLRIMRSGAAELRGQDEKLVDRFGETVSFNLSRLNREQKGMYVTLIEDSLIYFLPEETHQNVRTNNRDFDRFFHSQRNRRIRRAARHTTNPSEMMSRLSDVMSKAIYSVTPEHNIQQAAHIMSEKRISSILVMENKTLKGIVTDRDIRSRAVAVGLDMNSPISDIMTANPQTISTDKTVFDTTLLMTKSSLHHLPVVEDNDVVGMITSSDLMLARRDDPIYLVQHISRQKSVAELKKIIAKLPDLMIQWVHAGIRADQVAYIFTAVSDAVTAQLIDLFIEENGAAPVEFSWLGFGSQGRTEQLLGGDQDNALLISDNLQTADAAWFEKLSHWVCDGLNECGYVYCPGKIMATTDEWRQTLAGWQTNVSKWTRSPTPDAVMRVSIFFDLRVVYGNKKLGDRLHKFMLEVASKNSIFLASLAENVLDNKPPLGIFRQFVVEHDGEHNDELNLKKRGIIPIVDIARIHSLASRISKVNTNERFDALAKHKTLTINESRNLQDALRIIMQIRLREQVNELMAGRTPDNYINPDKLSKLVRKQLRDAFSVIRDAQQGIEARYRPGM